MSSENYSNCLSELDLDLCKDYFISKLVYDDGSIKYRLTYIENGFNFDSGVKELLFDSIHALTYHIVHI